MRIARIIAAALLTLSLGGCAADLQKLGQVYTAATTATVPASVVRPLANSFDILKGTAANFAAYCVHSGNTASGCDVDTRRTVSRAVKAGTAARVQLRASIATGQPAAVTVYNVLVDAVSALQASPVNSFTGGGN